MNKKNRMRRLGAILLIIFALWIALVGAIVPRQPERVNRQEELFIRRVNRQNKIAEDIYQQKLEAERREQLRIKRETKEKYDNILAQKRWVKEAQVTEDAWDETMERKARMARVASMISGGTKGDYQSYAYSFFDTYGWSEHDFQCLILLWERESNWSPDAHNGSSGAHGIPQSLPADKMASEGADYYYNGYTQIRWGLRYIASRYGSPAAAWYNSEMYGWY